MIDPNSLEAIYCPCCHKPAGQVIHAESNTRKGWWCEHCGHWVDAIARERLVETDNLQEQA